MAEAATPLSLQDSTWYLISSLANLGRASGSTDDLVQDVRVLVLPNIWCIFRPSGIVDALRHGSKTAECDGDDTKAG
jgi:hypothetical protein